MSFGIAKFFDLVVVFERHRKIFVFGRDVEGHADEHFFPLANVRRAAELESDVVFSKLDGRNFRQRDRKKRLGIRSSKNHGLAVHVQFPPVVSFGAKLFLSNLRQIQLRQFLVSLMFQTFRIRSQQKAGRERAPVK